MIHYKGKEIDYAPARVAKLVDALALGASTVRYEGSSPFPGTLVFL